MKPAFTLIVLCLIGQIRAPAQSTATADEAAIRALVVEFTRAFNAGDAKGVAALFTENARIATEGGDGVEGRTAIEKLFAESFSASPGQIIVVKTDSLRMLGSEAALEEGTATITGASTGDDADADADADARAGSSRYTAAYVKVDGKWLQDDVHDYPLLKAAVARPAHEHLKELEWLVGEWLDESDDAEVRTTCDWSDDHHFLLRSFKMRIGGRIEVSGVQRIGWDPRFNQFRSWVFDSEGGFSDGLWSRDDQGRWIIKSTGFLKDGRTVSATNILTRGDGDSLRWGSVDRTLGGNALSDVEEVVLVRKPPSPRGHDSASPRVRKPE
mgnify:CR=1 FL=1